MEKLILIRADENDSVVSFAGQELRRYLGLSGTKAELSEAEKGGTVSGLDDFIKTIDLIISPELFELSDNIFDDAYLIQIKDGSGRICGSNARSILLGVYRYLRELGFLFLRPDRDGERIPKEISAHTITVKEKAANRYRGMCIEGAVSFLHIISFIDWLPKMGFNTYFTQFLIPYEFFKTWYLHVNNDGHPKEEAPSPQQVDEFVKKVLVPQLKIRGIMWQAAGHGFTSEAVSLPGLGWDEMPEEYVPEETRKYLAQIDGKRELFHGVPLNTNLCYSNDNVQDILIEKVMSYLAQNPRLDILHFWLADGGNNSCECESCKKKLPADWYVDLLNQLEERVNKEKYRIKIVFLAYYDLLWPPALSRLKNPDNFIFLFAPITRSYAGPMAAGAHGKLPEFERNRCVFPKNVEDNLKFLSAWQDTFDGDSFLYDYHYMWSLFRDWGDYYLGKVLWEDIRNLPSLRLNGYVSCQQTRVFAPTGLGMYIMAQTLWNDSQSFEEMAAAYYEKVFGEEGSFVHHYCERLSALSYRDQPEEDGPGQDEGAAGRLKEAIQLIDESSGRIENGLSRSLSEGGDATAWKYLLYSARAAKLYLTVLLYRRKGEEERVAPAYHALKRYLCETESVWQEGFDLYWLIKDRDKIF